MKVITSTEQTITTKELAKSFIGATPKEMAEFFNILFGGLYEYTGVFTDTRINGMQENKETLDSLAKVIASAEYGYAKNFFHQMNTLINYHDIHFKKEQATEQQNLK